jgi:capsular polysaccharide biosynthesis protein
MRAAGTDAIGILRWGLARYFWLFAICVLLGAVVAPLLALQRTAVADARALVIAEQLDVDLSAIPRYGEAVFNNGEVAQEIASTYPAAGDQEDIIPNRVSLIAEQDSIVFGVEGHDEDPQVAADLANLAANTFVAALNSAGGGVGSFELQTPAQAPPEPENSLGTSYAIPVGVGAGVMLGLAAVSVLLVARRPVIDGIDAEEIVGVPSLGTVTVPRTRRGRFAPPEAFAGLVPVCRRLLALPTPTAVLVSRPRDEHDRMHLALALVSTLRLAAEVEFVGPAELGGTATDTPARAAQRPPANGHPARRAERFTVIDGGDLSHLIQPPHSTATVLVVPEGISSAALRAAVVEHLGGSAEARILLVRHGARTRGEAVSDLEPMDDVPARQTGAPVT